MEKMARIPEQTKENLSFGFLAILREAAAFTNKEWSNDKQNNNISQ